MTAPLEPRVAPEDEDLRTPLQKALGNPILASFLRSPVAIVSAAIVAMLTLAALFAPWITPHNPFDPSTLDLMEGFSPPLTPNDVTGRVFLLVSNVGRDHDNRSHNRKKNSSRGDQLSAQETRRERRYGGKGKKGERGMTDTTGKTGK